MRYSGQEIIEMVPKRGEEITSKMSMIGCGLQLLVLLFISQVLLWFFVFIAMLT